VIILLGVGTARFFLKYLKQLKGWTGKIGGTLLEIIVLLLVFDFIMWGNFSNLTRNVLLFFHTPLVKSLDLTNTNYVAAPIITLSVIAVFAIEKGIISHFLKQRFLLFLGEISFSIFISHQLLINYLFVYYKQFLLYTFGQLMTCLLLLAILILLASLIYIFIEDPIRNRLRISTN
jgi:peptidoglycan/LPS O-acetylase OafA/YrhL